MNNENLIKQLFYRSIHRGWKETDFLIGEFAKKKLGEISDLELFGDFLEEDDLEIYDWILGKNKEPEKYVGIIMEIKKFHKIWNLKILVINAILQQYNQLYSFEPEQHIFRKTLQLQFGCKNCQSASDKKFLFSPN